MQTIDFPVALIGFAAFSGTGKTSLLLKLLPLLKSTGLRIAVVKNAHHAFEMDQPGKDSYRLRKAGADEMLVAGRCRIGWIREFPEPRETPGLTEVLSVLKPESLDLVLVEGFKREPFPKIELHRHAMGRPLLFPGDPNIVAIATDEGELPCDPGDLPRLPLNQPTEIAGFILQLIGRDTEFHRPIWPAEGSLTDVQ